MLLERPSQLETRRLIQRLMNQARPKRVNTGTFAGTTGKKFPSHRMEAYGCWWPFLSPPAETPTKMISTQEREGIRGREKYIFLKLYKHLNSAISKFHPWGSLFSKQINQFFLLLVALSLISVICTQCKLISFLKYCYSCLINMLQCLYDFLSSSSSKAEPGCQLRAVKLLISGSSQSLSLALYSTQLYYKGFTGLNKYIFISFCMKSNNQMGQQPCQKQEDQENKFVKASRQVKGSH